jgi:MerR family transcriptional regulator, copper efflux regulator
MAVEPIACALSAADAVTRRDEWSRFFAGDVTETVRTAHAARLRLQDRDGAILSAIELARREKECCAFFDFRLVVLPEAIWLEIDAPDQGAAMLDKLLDRTQV